jgi:hypothetical protein
MEPDDFANVWTIIDWIDEFTNANNSPDLDDDDDELGAAWDPMADWELDGEEDEDDSGDGDYDAEYWADFSEADDGAR